MQIDDFYTAPKRVMVVETLISAPDAADRQDWQTIDTVHDTASAHLNQTARKPNKINKEWVRKVLDDDRLTDCIERAPNRDRYDADLFRGGGDVALQQTVGIVNPADHLLVTDSSAMFLRLDRGNFHS